MFGLSVCKLLLDCSNHKNHLTVCNQFFRGWGGGGGGVAGLVILIVREGYDFRVGVNFCLHSEGTQFNGYFQERQ